jgi:hypothetical protein
MLPGVEVLGGLGGLEPQSRDGREGFWLTEKGVAALKVLAIKAPGEIGPTRFRRNIGRRQAWAIQGGEDP